MRYDAIIIGAGMSGLAAGIRLAMFGKRVVILERHSVWGGLNSFYNFRGRQFDVGLHAMTNWAPKGARGLPLARLLKQLRVRHEELDLCEQRESAISFPGVKLRFSNDFELLRSEVARAFPSQVDGFEALTGAVRDYDELDLDAPAQDARPLLETHLTDSLLRDMLLCPLMFYGSARERDMDWDQFVVLFKSIYLQGFARPQHGVRHLLKLLTGKYRALGGELRMRCGVESILHRAGRVVGVTLEDDEELLAETVLSSAGLPETQRLAGENPPESALAGRLSFTESISVLDRPAGEIGIPETILFFCNRDRFDYARPEEAVDVQSGVICLPGNFALREPLADPMVRLTNLAHGPRWKALGDESYRREKENWYRRSVEAALAHVADFRPHVTLVDMFTPRTVEKFTGHIDGAVYGSPKKSRTGETNLEGLYLTGTDQGFLGIVGAVLSGITIANRYVLRADAAAV